MKKRFLILAMAGLLLTVTSCTRTEVDDPSWDGPAGFNVMLDGSANPAVLIINGAANMSTIRVRATTSAGVPLANKLIFFQQLDDGYQEVAWGQFENGLATTSKVTDANGETSVAFFSPLDFYSHNMYIHALMQVDGHAYNYNSSTGAMPGGVPQDYIAIAMVYGGN